MRIKISNMYGKTKRKLEIIRKYWYTGYYLSINDYNSNKKYRIARYKK